MHDIVIVCGKKYRKSLKRIEQMLGEILVNQQELAAKLNTLSTQVEKIGNETSASLTLIKQLKDELANGPIPPAVQEAVDKLEAQLTKVDDMVPEPTPPSPV